MELEKDYPVLIIVFIMLFGMVGPYWAIAGTIVTFHLETIMVKLGIIPERKTGKCMTEG